LGQVLASRTLAGSDRLRRFLRFVVETTLAGGADRIKEYSIGTEVYDRGDGFDPRSDAVVRAEAARLREKLRSYYETEGAGSAVTIELPKGGYVPVFRPGSPAPATPPQSIVVLPFVNMSPDPDTDHFADGLTEELIHGLARVAGLKVVARTSAFQFKGVAADVREVGARVGAGTVLEGSVRQARDGVRITAQLIGVADGYHLWSGVFTQKVDDAVEAQEELARAVVRALHGPLIGKRMTREQSGNPQARELYLRGRHGVRQWTVAGMQSGLASLRRAIEIDPSFAAAYEALAETLAMSLYFGALPTQWIVTELVAAAERALSLDNGLPGAHAALGAAHAVHDHDWERARRDFECSLEAAPQDAGNLSRFAFLYHLPLRRFEEALEMSQRALALDPADPLLGMSYATVYFWMGRLSEGVEHHREALALNPHFPQSWWNLGYNLAGAGDYAAALDAYRQADRLTGEGVNLLLLGDMGRVLALAGHTDEARRIDNLLEQRSRNAWTPPLARAWTAVGLGEYDAALDWMEAAYDARHAFLIWAAVDPRYEPLRGRQRFGDLLRRMGLER
jgi:serine/threonine-protein kinase